jgi:predicted ATPase/transcriptional regulator with XRE-family HTH domain
MARSATDHVAADTEPERFGVLLRRFRTSAGLSQERLAELARISPEAVSALERGTRTAPQRQTLALLVEALALNAGDRESLTLAAVRPQQSRPRSPRPGQPAVSFLLSAPSTMTSFVGREVEVAAISSLCRSGRLTSIVGAGGVGKSRLALEVARLAAPSFPDGVSIVALAPVLSHSAVLPAIASALGVRDEGGVALAERTVAAIGDRTMLLILDNCEHVLDELAPAVEHLLAHCPKVNVIATSRQRLRIAGERIYRLHPLSIGHAVDVFIDRAVANGFDPAADEGDLNIAAEICDRLDRMPLAIELAASCSDVLAFEAILARLRERSSLPATPARSALPQHRSMQALVEWSYDRLEPSDAVVFRQMAPFAGGCRLDDAQEIIGREALSKDDVLYALFRLHEQSLVDADRATIPRFQMLQTIRDFATLQLQPDERASLTRRFAEHYLTLVARAESDLRSARQDPAIERISAESTNVRAALNAVGTDPELVPAGLAALGSLSHFWLRTGTLTQGAEVYDSIDFAPYAPSASLVAALTGASFVELNRQVLPKARAYAKHARAVALAVGDPWLDVYSAIAEQSSATLSGEPPAPESFAPAYDRAQQLGDPWLIGSAAYCMAVLVQARDPASGSDYLEYALTCAQASGDSFALQSIQLALARATAASDPRRAATFVGAVWRELGPAHLVRKFRCVECLILVARGTNRLDDAALLAGIGRSILRQIGAPEAVAARLEATAHALLPARASLVAAGEAATENDATERVAAFIRSAGETE